MASIFEKKQTTITRALVRANLVLKANRNSRTKLFLSYPKQTEKADTLPTGMGIL